MKAMLRKLHRAISEKWAAAFLVRPHLQIILMHKVYPTAADIRPEHGSSDEGITAAYLDEVISWFKQRNYRFITPEDILDGRLDPKGLSVMLTFDDGYFNNFHALPVLEKHGVKATFYISSRHIAEGKSFWWDVVYRESWLRKYDQAQTGQLLKSCMDMPWDDCEEELRRQFGENALQPVSDMDRPMTPEELIKFSGHPLVEIGNHTHNHLKLINYSPDEMGASIREAEQQIQAWTGIRTRSISYPYGYYNDDVVAATEAAGYRLGITVDEGQENPVKLNDPQALLRLRRSHFVAWIPAEEQCYNVYSGFSLAGSLKSIFKR